MPKYQIEFKDSDSGAGYAYFEADTNIGQAACECADDFTKRNRPMFGFQVYDPPKTVMVREYDKVKKEVKPRGHQFQLRRRHFWADEYFYECKKVDALPDYSGSDGFQE